MRRRPSAATAIALLALFVALGGPARAARLINGSEIKKGTIRSKQIHDHSLRTRDLTRGAVRSLTATRNGSITDAELANGAVTADKLAGAAVTGGKLAASSVGPVQLANGAVTRSKLAPGSVTAADVARFAGRFTADVTAGASACWSRELPLHADISNSVVDVTPGTDWPRDQLNFTVQTSPTRDGFVISGCNRKATAVSKPGVVFRYIVFDVP